jgi:hypothetical protein
MASLAPAFVVDQPHLFPPAISLLTAAEVIDMSNERWVGGYTYPPEGCGEYDVFELCDTFEKSIANSSPAVTGTPFGIVASDTCSTFGWQARDYKARAMRKLLAIESFAIERELWTNSLGLNTAIAGAFATDVTPGGTPVQPVRMIAEIEQQAIDTCGDEGALRYMIHMTPYMFEYFHASSPMALRREGNRYFTPMDNIVVVGRGYTGSGPAGQVKTAAREWIYLTSTVQVRHSPAFNTPDTMVNATDTTINQVTFYAERAASAIFDTNCCHLALAVDRDG